MELDPKEHMAKLEEQFCDAVAEINRRMYWLAFLVHDNLDKGLKWNADSSDPNHRDVIAFVDIDGRLAEITFETIRVQTPDDEKLLHIEHGLSNGLVFQGFNLMDLPFLMKVPELLDFLEKTYRRELVNMMESISKLSKGR